MTDMATISTTGEASIGQRITEGLFKRVLFWLIAAVIVAIIFAYQQDQRVTTAVLAATLRQSIPLILGAL
jgi:hypothetical protein